MLKSVTFIEASFYCIVYCREDTGQILLTRLHQYLVQAEILPVSVRRQIDMILSVRNFQQKYQKQNMLDTVSRALENYINVWLSSQIYNNGSAVQ